MRSYAMRRLRPPGSARQRLRLDKTQLHALRCGAAAQAPALRHPALSRSNWGSSTQGSELDRKLESVLKDYQLAQGQKRQVAGVVGGQPLGYSSELKSRPSLQKRLVQKVLFVCNDYNSYTFEEDGEYTCTEGRDGWGM